RVHSLPTSTREVPAPAGAAVLGLGPAATWHPAAHRARRAWRRLRPPAWLERHLRHLRSTTEETHALLRALLPGSGDHRRSLRLRRHRVGLGRNRQGVVHRVPDRARGQRPARLPPPHDLTPSARWRRARYPTLTVSSSPARSSRTSPPGWSANASNAAS